MLAPGVQVYTPYGATEALPVACIGSDEILGETRQRTAAGAGVCVGRPVDGVEVAIIRISDEPIAEWSDDLLVPPGEIGEIVVHGPVVTREYFNRPEATALAKIAAPNDFYHRMGDLGYFDEQGRLWFCGRKSQRVVTAGRHALHHPVRGGLQHASAGVSHGPGRRRTERLGPAGPVRRTKARQHCRSGSADGGAAGARRRPAAHALHSDHSVSSGFPGGHPAQRQDLPREAGPLGGEAAVMKALVTGGGGFLGSAIVRRLVARGDTVRSFSRAGIRSWTSSAWSSIPATWSTPKRSRRRRRAATSSFTSPPRPGSGASSTTTTRPTSSAPTTSSPPVDDRAIQRLVYTSSPSVVFDGRDMEGVDESVPYPQHYEAHYPRTKAEAERRVLAANGPELATVALRPHLIWGPGDPHLVPRILAKGRAGRLRRIGKQDKLVDTVYIDNAADAHLLAADRLARGVRGRRQGLFHRPGRAAAAVGADQSHPGGGKSATGAADHPPEIGLSDRMACGSRLRHAGTRRRTPHHPLRGSGAGHGPLVRSGRPPAATLAMLPRSPWKKACDACEIPSHPQVMPDIVRP